MRARSAAVASPAKGDAALLTLAFTAKVAASPRRVWRALTSPPLAARWLPAHEGWLAPPPERFALGEPLRFRTRLRRVPASGTLRVLEVRSGSARVRVRVRLGLFAFEARFWLGPEQGMTDASRIGLWLGCENRVALVSGSLDRFEVRRLASEIAEQTLAALTLVAEELERSAARTPPARP